MKFNKLAAIARSIRENKNGDYTRPSLKDILVRFELRRTCP